MKKLLCPKCNSENTVPIVYGFIDIMPDEEDKGDYEVGGCVVTGNDPDYSCKDCGHNWVVE